MLEEIKPILKAFIWFILFFVVLYFSVKIMSIKTKKKELPQNKILVKVKKKNKACLTITFEDMDGNIKTLSVMKPVYDYIKEEDIGELDYQKDTFLSFERKTDEEKR